MTNFKLPFLGLLGGTFLLTGSLASPAMAAPPSHAYSSVGITRTAPRLPNPDIDHHHMPGWDWWRTYPWSPYNAYRNPYWFPPYNSNYPYPPSQANLGPNYPYPVPYAYGNPAPAYYPAYGSGLAPGARPLPALQPEVPHPTADLQSPPPNTALIRVRVPEQFTTVTFNGQKAGGVGTTRTYVTPELQDGKGYRYAVGATVKQDRNPTTVTRFIDVAPGKIAVVDFAGGR